MELVLFFVVFIPLWFLLYVKYSLTRLRTITSIFSMSAMTRAYLVEITDCALAVFAAASIGFVTVWWVSLFQ